MSQEILPNLFKEEFSKITSVICKTFGLTNIQVAEDLVSETFLVAAETWGLKGIPENPKAWLYSVAKNKTKDFLKRHILFRDKIKPEIQSSKDNEDKIIDLSEKNIIDSQLLMLFAICNTNLGEEAQIALSLRILCGFGVEEIAKAFFSNKDTINKRMHRAKEKLRNSSFQKNLENKSIQPENIDNVLRIIYLVFNEGYYSSSVDKIIRKELCIEAMRLCYLLLQLKETQLPRVNALLALICFQVSRFDARTDDSGLPILYYEQDKALWNNDLISKGEFLLNQSAEGSQISKYHLEAGIAFWHTRVIDDKNKWENILQLYNQLLQIDYSPAVALNRTYALSRANGKLKAIKEALKINLNKHYLYHSLLAELYKDINPQKEKEHLRIAISLTKKEEEIKLLTKRLNLS